MAASAVALVEPAAQVYPALHAPLQLALLSPVVLPNLPAGHGEQIESPAAAYVPGMHSTCI